MHRHKKEMAKPSAQPAKPRRARSRKGTADPDSAHRRRFNALGPDRKANLLDPAEAEFATRGFEGASLNRILEKAGFSKGQAYYYVKDKAELYSLVLARAFARVGAAIGPLPPVENPDDYWADIGRLFRRLSAVLGRGTRLGKLVRAIYPASPAANAALEPLLARFYDRLQDHVRLGQSIGAIRADLPPDFLAAGALGFLARIDRWFAVNKPRLTELEALRLNDAVTQMCRAMASTRRDPQPPTNERDKCEGTSDSRPRQGDMP